MTNWTRQFTKLSRLCEVNLALHFSSHHTWTMYYTHSSTAEKLNSIVLLDDNLGNWVSGNDLRAISRSLSRQKLQIIIFKETNSNIGHPDCVSERSSLPQSSPRWHSESVWMETPMVIVWMWFWWRISSSSEASPERGSFVPLSSSNILSTRRCFSVSIDGFNIVHRPVQVKGGESTGKE